MLNQPSSPPKPITDVWRPDLVQLPRLTLKRRFFRQFVRGFFKLLKFLFMDVKVSGLENFPKIGPALVAINHLGDADAVLLGAVIPQTLDGVGKIELNNHWLIGPLFRNYGVIWLHRGRPDRKALRAVLDGLAEGRFMVIAPEGRQSLIGGLEDGNNGAAFLALKSGAPIVPVAMTGTENSHIFPYMKRLKRAPVTLMVGKPFYLTEQANGQRQIAIQEGTRQIMHALANLLPESYRGNYKSL
jgi:1-acyl-sn-glycerol-3-phosphate acyltransferase